MPTPEITVTEVGAFLKATNHGASGSDKIRKFDLNSLFSDEVQSLFTNLFAFKVGTTTKMLFSASHNQYPAITLASMVSRLFHRFLNSRMSLFIKLGPMHSSNTTAKCGYLLNSIIIKYKQVHKSLKLYVLFLSLVPYHIAS